MRAKDFTNQVFGSLTALYQLPERSISGSYFWQFRCNCGNLYKATAAAVKQQAKIAKNPQTPSCGCTKSDISKETAKIHRTKHGYNRKGNTHPLYLIYRAMFNRCYNPNSKSYKNYGAVGVTICQEWLDNPVSFIEWALQNGWQKGLEIDKDLKATGSKIYSPDTCSIISKLENTQLSHLREYAYGKAKHIKLSPQAVQEILDKYSTNNFSQQDLAQEYNVSRSAIQRILNLSK